VEIVRHWGYPAESLDATTSDGYILSMIRIPHGRAQEGTAAPCNRTPILLVHGLFEDAAAFIMNPPISSAGMILADAGFDVFILNSRGTPDSQRHTNMTSDDPRFWEFTMDNMANYDVPAAIDRALQVNGADSLYYVGHSQGTVVAFLMLAENPAYNAKTAQVRAMFELCPAGSLHYMKGAGRFLIELGTSFSPLFDV
ncbi:hypothetical protein PFISCL1PPCAC_12756, partial [Pristionchus fissidentatus]